MLGDGITKFFHGEVLIFQPNTNDLTRHAFAFAKLAGIGNAQEAYAHLRPDQSGALRPNHNQEARGAMNGAELK